MNKEFSNNPFAKLQENVQVKPKTKSSKPEPKPKQNIEADTDLDDTSLFLNAMRTTKQSSQKKSKHVPLAEHKDFAKLKKNSKEALKSKHALQHTSQVQEVMGDEVIGNSTNYTSDHNTDHMAEDAKDFMKAMQEVAPLSGKGRDIAPEVKLSPPMAKTQDYQHLLESNVEFAMALKGEYLEGHVVGLDENIMNALRAGQYSPEASIDLHGLNSMQAYSNLIAFFRGAWYKGFRNVLVVPGRGKNSLNGVGILRDKLQTWLTQEPFKRVVLAFCTARPVDGGPGSVYVLLRKYKKKGKIHWERLPSDPDLF